MAARVALEAAVDADRRRTDPGSPGCGGRQEQPGRRSRPAGPAADPGPGLGAAGCGRGGRRRRRRLLVADRGRRDDVRGTPGGNRAADGRRRAVDPMWTMLRTSIGFIGIVMHRADSNALANFLEMHYQRKPPDILLIEWVAGNWEGGVRAHGTRARGERLIPDSKDPTLRTVSKSAARAPWRGSTLSA